MTELEFYKFLHSEDGSNPEMHWHPGRDTGGDDQLMVFVHPAWVDTFANLVGDDYFSDGAMECHMTTGGYIVVDIVPICEHFEIDPKNLLDEQ